MRNDFGSESKWLKADDLQGREYPLTISGVSAENMGEGEIKPALHFHGAEKGMVLNVTNRLRLCDAFGDDSDTWVGKRVIVYSESTTFRGQPTKGLRVRPAQQAPPAPPVQQAPPPHDPNDPSDLPF